MKKYSLYLLLCFVWAIAPAALLFGQDFDYHRDFKEMLERSKRQSDPYYYPSLLQRFNTCDSNLTDRDVVALQIGFTAHPEYKPYKTIDKESAILDLVAQKLYEKAIVACDELLQTNPVDFTAVLEKGFCYMNLGKPDPCYKEKALMLIRCIKWSGDGSQARPCFVLSPIDGQTFITHILGGSLGTMGS
ncbi:DUF4919 domain-containing protein [Taibaiella koreensis]|uniref:DUF4919 domain-containing protein n=1 Tax=Taibaiella koreensis TaxID=1268548 RepID=UPI000E59BF2A|nr:DUF4919 domain-containing protein [Taibaiella koreensis]